MQHNSINSKAIGEKNPIVNLRPGSIDLMARLIPKVIFLLDTL
jgi:hypothetical protein